MSDRSFKSPSSAGGTNPSLDGQSTKEGSANTPREARPLPGAFVPPSDAVARAVPKKRTSKATEQKRPFPLKALLGVMSLAAAFGAGALFTGNDREESSSGSSSSETNEDTMPDWVPTYPSGVRTFFSMNEVGGKPTGNLQYTTTNTHRAVIEYYKRELSKRGFVITSFDLSKRTASLEAKSEDGSKKVTVTSELSPEGAKTGIVFSAADPDRSRPVAGGSLPEFAELYPKTKLLELSSRIENGAIAGHFRLEAPIQDRANLRKEIGVIADFYEPKLKAAHYEFTREDADEFTTFEAVSLKNEGPVDLYVVEEDGVILITMKVLPRD